jgi:HD-like signal output (HDOD) protein
MSSLEPFTIDPKTFLIKHCSLPALPEILNQIQEIMYSKDVSVDKLAKLISKDAALVAQILKIVNSAYYSLPIEISEVRHAVAYLGMNEIHRIILSLSIINTLSIEDKSDFNAIWFHSLLTALCAKYIAQKYEPKLNVNELWSAALLHDIGKFVYLKFFPDHYKTLWKYSRENSCLFSEAEIQFSFPSSSYIGTLLCERWRLPEKIKNVCSFHSLQDLKNINENNDVDPYVSLVIVGNLIAIIAADEISKDMKEEISTEIEKTLNIDKDDLWFVLGEVNKLKETARNLMRQLN